MKVRQGNPADLPQFTTSEFGYATDVFRLYIVMYSLGRDDVKTTLILEVLILILR